MRRLVTLAMGLALLVFAAPAAANPRIGLQISTKAPAVGKPVHYTLSGWAEGEYPREGGAYVEGFYEARLLSVTGPCPAYNEGTALYNEGPTTARGPVKYSGVLEGSYIAQPGAYKLCGYIDPAAPNTGGERAEADFTVGGIPNCHEGGWEESSGSKKCISNGVNATITPVYYTGALLSGDDLERGCSAAHPITYAARVVVRSLSYEAWLTATTEKPGETFGGTSFKEGEHIVKGTIPTSLCDQAGWNNIVFSVHQYQGSDESRLEERLESDETYAELEAKEATEREAKEREEAAAKHKAEEEAAAKRKAEEEAAAKRKAEETITPQPLAPPIVVVTTSTPSPLLVPTAIAPTVSAFASTVGVNLATGIGSLSASCAAPATEVCTFSLTLVARVKNGHASSAAKVKVGTVSGKSQGGKSGKLAVKLTKAGRKFLKHGAIHLEATGTVKDSAGLVTRFSRRVTVKKK